MRLFSFRKLSCDLYIYTYVYMYLFIDVNLTSFISGGFMGALGGEFSAPTPVLCVDDTKFH